MEMQRSMLVPVAAAVLALGIASAASARPDIRLPAQQDDPQPAPVLLAPGERYSHGTWELEVQRYFVASSPHKARYSEVRMAVAFRNTSGTRIAFDRAALGDPGPVYPMLQLRDAAGVVHPLPLVRPDETSVPGSNLGAVPSGVTARWTVGFQVPSIYDDALVAEAVVDGRVVAAWELERGPRPLTGWGPLQDMEMGALGSTVQWTDDLWVTPGGYGTLTCGNPAVEHAVLVFGLEMAVDNRSFTDSLWTATKYPRVPAIALWGDGGSARFALEMAFVSPDPLALNRRSFEEVVIPPHLHPNGTGRAASPEARGMVFVLPRDGRLGAVEVPPQAVVLYPPRGGAVWVPITGAPSFTPPTALCARYRPSIPYDVIP